MYLIYKIRLCLSIRLNARRRLESLVNMVLDMVPLSEKWLRKWKLPSTANTPAPSVAR